MILPGEIGDLIAALQREVAGLRRENEALRAENAELRRRLDLDSSTSSKPPSGDGLRKKPASLREPSGKASGGQAGHKGDTLKRVADPDRIVVHEARAGRHCGAGLRLSMARETETRQVFDLPEKGIEITERRRPGYACAGCGGRNGGRPFTKASRRPRNMASGGARRRSHARRLGFAVAWAERTKGPVNSLQRAVGSGIGQR